MRELLAAVAAGECSPEEAEARLRGYVETDAGRFDAARERRRGIPEAILAAGKTPEEVADLATTALETTGRALLTRVDDATAEAVRQAVVAESETDGTIGGDDKQTAGSDKQTAGRDETSNGERGEEGFALQYDDRSGVLVVEAADYERPTLDARVQVVTGGTADRAVAREACAIVEAGGADCELCEDVGVASLARLLDALPAIREADVVIAVAGREGALPTVLAGLLEAPVIGVPVASGYGSGGDGEAALAGLLQSCTVLSVVNIDAGYTAGAQAVLIARGLDAARADDRADRRGDEP